MSITVPMILRVARWRSAGRQGSANVTPDAAAARASRRLCAVRPAPPSTTRRAHDERVDACAHHAFLRGSGARSSTLNIVTYCSIGRSESVPVVYMTIYDNNDTILSSSARMAVQVRPISASAGNIRGNCRCERIAFHRPFSVNGSGKDYVSRVMYPALFQRVLRRAALVAALVAACAIAATVGVRLARVARPVARRPFDGNQPAVAVVAARRQPGVAHSDRQPIVAGGVRQSPLSAIRRSAISRNTQERLVAIDAETGKVVWEQPLQPVPQRRAAASRRRGRRPRSIPKPATSTSSPSAAQLICVAPDGKVLWDRSLPDEYGAVTTHGGRTTSPIIEGDKVILNALMLAWGDLNRTGNRYFAFDKKTGQTIWISSPQARHYDTNYSTPIVADHRRHARADRRRHRRRVSRAQGQHRREDLVDRSQQARDSQQRAVPRQRRLHHARRREHRHHRDGHDRRGRRDQDRRAHARMRSSGARAASCRRLPRR